MPSKASVTKMCRRRGSTGSSSPAIRPTSGAQGPAALTTSRVAMVPAGVRTPVTRPCSTTIPVTGVPSTMRTPRARAWAA